MKSHGAAARMNVNATVVGLILTRGNENSSGNVINHAMSQKLGGKCGVECLNNKCYLQDLKRINNSYTYKNKLI